MRAAPALAFATLVLAVTAGPAAAGDWLPPVDLAEPGATVPQEDPLAAMGANGDTTVV